MRNLIAGSMRKMLNTLVNNLMNLLKDSVKILLLAGLYFLAARFGLGIDAVGGFATLVWPPTGIAIAALLLFGYRLWPGILIGALAANFVGGAPIFVALGIAIGNSLEALLGSYFLKKSGFKGSFNNLKIVLALIALTALISTIVSATIGVTSLLLGGVITASSFVDTWIPWWIGDMLGALVMIPLIVTWRRLPEKYFTPVRLVEALALAVLLGATNLLVFINPLSFNLNISAVTYLIFPPLIWAAIRFGQYGGTLAVLLTSILAILGTVNDLGPFVMGAVSDNLIELQSFLAVIIMTTLIIAAIISESEDAEERVEQLNKELKGEVSYKSSALAEAQAISHIGSWEWDLVKDTILYSDELYKIYGLDSKSLPSTRDGLLVRVHPDDESSLKQKLDEIYKNYKEFDCYYRINSPSGVTKTIHAIGKISMDGSGKAVKISGIAQDVTEEKSILDALKLRTQELEKLNQFMIDRELKMAELKKSLETLEKKNPQI